MMDESEEHVDAGDLIESKSEWLRRNPQSSKSHAVLLMITWNVHCEKKAAV